MLENGLVISFNGNSVSKFNKASVNETTVSHINMGYYLKTLYSETDTIEVNNLHQMYNKNINFWVKLINNKPYHKGVNHILISITVMHMNVGLLFYINREDFYNFVSKNSQEVYKVSS